MISKPQRPPPAKGFKPPPQYMPDVRNPAEHEALQGVVKHYTAAPYAEWKPRQEREIADLIGSGHEVRMVEMTAAEFTAHCDRTDAKRDISTFKSFVSDKGKRQPSP